MFKENFLIFGYGELINPIGTPQDRKTAEAQRGTEFVQKRLEAASEELQTPIRDAIRTTKNAIGFTFLELPKKSAQKILGYANDIAFAVAAAPANIGRWAMDMLSLPGSVYTVIMSKLNELSFGKISKVCKRSRDKMHQTLGSAPSYQTA